VLKILTIIGARPQFIKAATVSRELKKTPIQEVIVHTGQHFDPNMSQVFFDEMEIPAPNYNLEINNLNHAAMTGRMMEKIEEVLVKEKPNCVLVYGDTNSTLAGALTAAKLHVPVAHVEAGLRSFDMQMPEEINRILTDRISKLLFCPTIVSVLNLEKEGFKNFDCEIVECGDVMYDAVLYYKDKAKLQSTIVAKLNLKSRDFILVTIHRAENTNDPSRLRSIADALNELSKTATIVLPLHPRTKAYLQSQQITINAKIIEPVGYFDMLALLMQCKLVMTDSGGLQKEAYFFGKYCLTLRDQTEWVELVTEGANSIVGADKQTILDAYKANKNKTLKLNPLMYGKGNAAQRIVEKIQSSM
jgi:UDP-GlcNAc3NAcA epimerase